MGKENSEGAPLCRVVVVNSDTRDLLSACLDALEREMKRTAGLEVTVVDAASTDGSARLVRERYPWARLLALRENRGYSHAINRGCAGARARHLLIMNSDVILQEGAVSSLAAFLDGDAARAVAGPLIMNPDGSMQRSRNRSFPGIAAMISHACGLSSLKERLYRGGWTRKTLARCFWTRSRPVQAAWVGGSCFMVKREAFEAIGGMDEEFFLYCEDTDFCKRITDSGRSVHFVPGARAVHYWNSSIGKLPDSGFLTSVSSSLLYCRKHSPRLLPLAKALSCLGVTARLLAAVCASILPGRMIPSRTRVWLCGEALEIVTGSPVRERLKFAVTRVLSPARSVLLSLLFPAGGKTDGRSGLGCLRNILVLRYDGIGDMVLTLPLLEALAGRYPGARLIVLASPGNAAVASASPHVHEVVEFRAKSFPGILRVLRRLRSLDLDLVVDPMIDGSARTALLAYLTGARYRCGFACGGRERFFNVRAARGDLNTDMLENMACLAESLGAPRGEWRLEGAITSPGNGRMRAEPVAGRIPGGKPLVGIHPGGRYSTQRWPLRRFQETAWELLRGGCQVLFFQEPGAGAPLPAGLVVPEAGTVADLIARLPAVDLLLCNNSGPLHIARALGVPTVSLAGPTRNAFLPHEGEKHTVLGAALPCRPCDKAVCWHHTCLESIEVARVVSAVRAKLENLPACSALLPALPPEGGGKKERGTR